MLEKIRADDEIDFAPIDQGLRLVDGDIGFKFVVFDDNLHVTATQLAAEIFDRQLEAVAQLLTEHRGWSG